MSNFECPRCSVSRERREYCQNPVCPDSRAKQGLPMCTDEIVAQVTRMFHPHVSPGAAFDCLFALRQGSVTVADIHRALVESVAGQSKPTASRPAPPLPVRKHGIPQENTDVELPLGPEADPAPPVFTDPEVDFGRYKGTRLSELMKINPGYVKWMVDSLHNKPYLQVQARLAQFSAQIDAEPGEDTEATGYFRG